MPMNRPTMVALFIAAILGAAAAVAGDTTAAPGAAPRPYSPNAREYPTHVYFGDTHLHTAVSMDAGAAGARLTPRDAYKFAKGYEVTSNSGQPVRLARPLDFLVVADHSDGMGFFPLVVQGTPEIMASEQGKKWHDLIASGHGPDAAMDIIRTFSQGKMDPSIIPVPGTAAYRSTWDENIAAAEEANEPGRFTALIGYEWTSLVAGNNLHRNVIFRDDGKVVGQVEPYITMKPIGSNDPVDLWKWLDAYEKKTGGKVLAISHNGNLSNGTMFPMVETIHGEKVDRAYAETRARWERLYEVTQTKGDGETHPVLSPNDEFANFERWDKGNLDASQKKTPEMLQYEYARQALRNGLALERKLGVNPYKFGLVGSTDSHTGLATADEDNFFGKLANAEPSQGRATHAFVDNPKNGIKIMEWQVSASGYVGVWAKENTRASLFDAMQRRETYATTGPRMVVRFFGGWDFAPQDALSRRIADAGYGKGVPMGGDIKSAPTGKSPTFLVAAMKDPLNANLDRIQIVKGWIDARGETHEQVYDVAWSGDRKPGKDGKVPAVGSTVDVANATWSDTIGASTLVAAWKDPKFDPKQSAFYYARVLQIPTPRWPAYDAKYFGTKMPPEVAMTLQDRAYTSPIWYTP